MRAIIFILAGLSLCHMAVAQSPDAAHQNSADTHAQAAPAAVPLTANTLYMCQFQSNSPLVKLNVANGAPTIVGPMQTSERCTDLAFRKTTAAGTELFGTSFTRLFKVNPTTGKATLLANTFGSGITDINALVAQPGTGKLYGAGSEAPGQFVDISPTTGKATRKGDYGAGLGSAGDLAFLNGQLYGLLTKTSTGTRTYLAKISLAASTIGKATSVLPIQRRINGNLVPQNEVWGLVVRGGVMFAAMRSGELLTLNPGSGLATLKGDNNRQQAGLALSP